MKSYEKPILILLLITGIGTLLYPSVAGRLNAIQQELTVSKYNETVSETSESYFSIMWKEAEDYNTKIKDIGSAQAFLQPEQISGYETTFDPAGTGIMGRITIDKIGVDLPIYHGTDENVLTKGAGHLKGSSLPIGGEGNHSVIAGHSGLPGSRLFDGLDRLCIGDIFTLHILDEDLIYEIDRIVTVLPTQMDELYLQEGKDYCTLMTCTPYGINTYRLLVRGHRISQSLNE